MAQTARPMTGILGRYALSVGHGVALLLVASIASADGSGAQKTAGDAGSAPMSTGRVVGLAMGAVGAVGIVAGGVFGALTFSSVSAQKADCASSASCPNPERAQSDHTTAATDGTVSTFSFIAGGALFAAGAVLFFASPSAPGPSSSSVTLYPTVGLGGVSLRGAF